MKCSFKVIPIFENTYGLVACGGISSRMGEDKSMIVYHDIPQRYYVYGMLKPVCQKVFISCNSTQAFEINNGYDFLVDDFKYRNSGPMAALLTAFDMFKGRDILLIGCDYPFLDRNELMEFARFCEKQMRTTAFYDIKENCFEPLLGWYRSGDAEEINYQFSEGNYSIRQFLNKKKASKYLPSNRNCMTNVNDRSEFRSASEKLLALHGNNH
jgi:molybdenum cofactor guanylyltransferase